MAYANPRFAYHPPQSDSALENHHNTHNGNNGNSNTRAAFIVDNDDSAVLDPSVLDADMMQSPTHGDPFRKDSFATGNGNGVLSPAESQAWEHQYHNTPLSVEPASGSTTNHFHDHGNVFAHHASQPGPVFVQPQPPPPWTFEQASGNGTSTTTTGADFMPPPPRFDASYSRADSARGSFSQPTQPSQPAHPQHYGVSHSENSFIPAPQVQTPLSPHSHQDWMGMAQQEMENRPSHKRVRPESPARTHVDFQRRDGIRKKNGRIDIPHERNIQNIDDMIESTNDEDLLKELKQQKRLLRNREAALASRQRKKKHTEDLEVKEKNYTNQISMLETKVNELTMEHEHRDRERQAVHQSLAEAQRIIDLMHDEKRELIMNHNEEASNLRRKIQVLEEQLESGPAPVMSAMPSSNGFTDFNAEMEALNMGPHDWDSFVLASELQHDGHDDFSFDPRPEPVQHPKTLEKKASTATITQSSKRPQDSLAEQPFASGLLFMLLLCGAFVASKPASLQPSGLPDMPADVRAAAPAVLSNLLSDANSDPFYTQTQTVARMSQEPMASDLPYGNPTKPSRLDRIHHTLTSQTKQQEIDQTFALTTAQYASLTNMDIPSYSQPAISGGEAPRRNLAEALANLEREHHNSKAEVYTRSLLWDQIPADVVRQFKEIVRDHNEIEERQRQQSGYKVDH